LSSDHVERRLAAILAADVAGSCRLIGIDEEDILAELKALRNTIFDPKIADHHGGIVKNTGDGALVEFAAWSMGTNQTNWTGLTMSGDRGRPEVTGGASNRRHCPVAEVDFHYGIRLT